MDLIGLNWTNEDYKAFKKELLSLSDEKYRDFSSGLIPGARPLIGIRVPMLRDIAKQIAKGNWNAYINSAKDDMFEEVMLQGLILGYIKTDAQALTSLIKAFVPKINDWSVCDSTCMGLKKFAAKNKALVFELIKAYLKSENEFELRFAIIMLMSSYIDDDSIDDILNIYNKIRHDGYYVKMGVAWGLSVCFVKYEEKTMRFLKNNRLDNFTYNKALQKIIESNRVDKETKLVIKGMKRKVR